MTAPRLAALTAKLLARSALPAQVVAASERDRAIAQIERALVRKAQRRRLYRASGLVAATHSTEFPVTGITQFL